MTSPRIKIAIIAGEESGDILGADLIAALRKKCDLDVIGVGGQHLAGEGLQSLFNPAEIALMGISAIVKKLPRLVSLIGKTADFVVQQRPDCLIIIDSPEFCQRVAKKVRRADPSIPIINYICPSVWAWRPGRAKAMKSYIDHILAILPFEPQALAELQGPPTTYVGHRAVRDVGFIEASAAQAKREPSRQDNEQRQLLILPGSRRSEVRRTMPHFEETLRILKSRGHSPRLLLPTVAHVEADARRLSEKWAIQPEITTDPARKLKMFSSADAALAASGTVTLELALCRVPMVAIYDFDTVARLILRFFFKGWTASLPNLIADEPIVPEQYNDQIRPANLARQLERIMAKGPARDAQLAGFTKLRTNMQTDVAPGEKAATIVLDAIKLLNAKA
ncbi:MAG: lipid-A-disaccharide synthase [Rhizobiaceae bacterium]